MTLQARLSIPALGADAGEDIGPDRGLSPAAGTSHRSTGAIAQRIAIMLHDFSGGGTERVAIRLANAWAAEDRDVTIFCGTVEGCLRDLVEDRVAVVPSLAPCPRSATSRLTLAGELVAYARVARPDIVFAPGNFHLPVLARFAACDRSGATTVAKISNPLARSSSGLVRGIKGAGLRRLTRSIDCLVAMSPVLRAEARTILRRDDLALAWEPILAAPPVRRIGRRDGPIVVVGRLEAQKNVALALEAFARAKASACTTLLVLGEGRERAALRARAQRLGIADRVHMPGHSADVMGAFANASMLLLTSRYEGYPAVLVEAMAAGLPIVATRCSPAIEEMLGDDPASAIVDADATRIAAAIDATLAGTRDGRSVRPAVERHAVPEAAARYLAILDAARAKAVRRGQAGS